MTASIDSSLYPGATPKQLIAIDKLVVEIANNPLTQRYAHKVDVSVGQGDARLPGLRFVADALGERETVCALPLAFDVSMPHLDSLPIEEQWTRRIGYAALIQKAPLFLWRSTIIQEVKAMTLPPHLVSRSILPYSLMYFTFEDALRITDIDTHKHLSWLDWLLIYENPPTPGHEQGGFSVLLAQTTDSGEISLNGFTLPYGTRYPDDVGAKSLIGELLTLLAFLNSPYVEVLEEQAERPARREWARTRSDPPPTIRTVMLRATKAVAANSEPSEMSGSHPGATGHWHVRSHVRAQWYPSEKAHHVVYIAAQIRGDRTKPLKAQRVYKVSR